MGRRMHAGDVDSTMMPGPAFKLPSTDLDILMPAMLLPCQSIWPNLVKTGQISQKFVFFIKKKYFQ